MEELTQQERERKEREYYDRTVLANMREEEYWDRVQTNKENKIKKLSKFSISCNGGDLFKTLDTLEFVSTHLDNIPYSYRNEIVSERLSGAIDYLRSLFPEGTLRRGNNK